MKRRNIVGQQFGLLTVLKEIKNEKGYFLCECKCQCGTIKKAFKGNILSGKTRSCGCLEEKNRKKFHDLSGKRFGRLIAVTPTNERKDGNVVWICHCDCGRTVRISGRNLIRGFTKSCGCHMMKKQDISNQRFGKLIALYPDRKQHKSPQKWICQCDCGKTCSVSISNLRNKHTQSCGCLKEKERRTLIDGTCLEVIVSKKINKNNRSGVKGVSYHSKTNSWIATLTFKGKRYYLGKHENILDAARARWQAEDEIVKPFIKKHSHLLKNK